MKTAFFLATVASAESVPQKKPVTAKTDGHIPQTDAVDAVPTDIENAEIFQSNLDFINEKRQHHCAAPYQWSAELARNAQILADCWKGECKKEHEMHSTKSWLAYNASEDVLNDKVVESDPNVFQGLDAAAGGWYNADENKPPTDLAFVDDMVDQAKKDGANALSNLYVSLVWRGGLNMGCAVSAAPERAAVGTAVVDGQIPSKSKIVCIFQGLLVGPGAMAPAESQGGAYQYFGKELYPYQADFATECADAKYVPKTLFKFENTGAAFLQTVNLYRAHTCTPAVKWDTDMKAGVDKVMECYSNLAKHEGITQCSKVYEESFPSSGKQGGQWASILARTDYCDEANAGCGIAFNLPESRALLGVFHWFNRFKVETGVDAKTLTHGKFIEIFDKLNEDQKKDLNTFTILNWKANTGVYCDVQEKRFAAPNAASVSRSYIVCAVRTADDTRPPAYEKGTGPDRYDEWQANLFPGSGCRKKATAPADANDAVDATAAPPADEDEDEDVDEIDEADIDEADIDEADIDEADIDAAAIDGEVDEEE